MKIEYKIIEHADQRYETVGDWFWDEEGTLQIRASRCGDERFERLIILHELVEILLTEWTDRRPLKTIQELTEAHDKRFEQNRTNKAAEPGYDVLCPVYQQHMVASALEHIAAMMMGVDYNQYIEAIAALSNGKVGD